MAFIVWRSGVTGECTRSVLVVVSWLAVAMRTEQPTRSLTPPRLVPRSGLAKLKETDAIPGISVPRRISRLAAEFSFRRTFTNSPNVIGIRLRVEA
jgi:hypothetical protein